MENKDQTKELTDKVIRFYELTNEINELKESVKERNNELNDLYTQFAEYFKQTGESVIHTESGKFELLHTVKYNKKKRG